MTNEEAQTIAECAIRMHDAAADLRVSEERGNYRQARELRWRVSEAQAALDRAVEAVER